MKQKLFIMLIALLPLATFAGNGNKKSKEVNVTISVNTKGKVEVKGLTGDLKNAQKDINEALKNITVKIDDGKKNHSIHIKASINKN